MKPTRLTPLLLCIGACLFVPASSASCQNTRENADFKLAVNLYNDGLYDLAVEQLKQFIAAYPTTSQGIDARFTLGLAEQKLKNYEDARVTLQSFALTYQDHPKAPDAWWHVGEVYAAMHNDKEAALAFERVKVFHPRSKQAPDALLSAASYFAKAGEPENARRTLRALVQEYPTSSAAPRARMQLARMAFEDGSADQAKLELKKIVEANPSPEDRAEALLILGDIARKEGRIAEAEARYQEVVTRHPKTPAAPFAFLDLGRLLASTGRYREALDILRKAAGASAADSSLHRDALLAIADAQSAMGDYAAASASYDRALSPLPVGPAEHQLVWKFALALARSGQYRRSDELCALLSASGVDEPVRKRAMMLTVSNALAQGNTARSAQLRENFVELFPNDHASPGILYSAASITAAELRNKRKAGTLFETVHARYPSSPFAPRALFDEAAGLAVPDEAPRAAALYRQLCAEYPCAELAPEAARRADSLETFVVRNRDDGMEQLSLLMGDVIAGQDKADLSFRLGLIYYNNLKNYEGAAAQFSAALEGGLKPEQAAEAVYLKARSLELLSRHDTSRIAEARQTYRSYLTLAASRAHVDEAERSTFLLSATSLPSAREAGAPLLDAASTFTEKGLVLLTLGKLCERADSTDAALTEYARASRTGADPAVQEEALFRSMSLLSRLGRADSAIMMGESLVDRFPRGTHAALALAACASMSMANNDPARAAKLYRRLTAAYAYTDAGTRAGLDHARALFAAGSFDDAVAGYGDVLQQIETDPSHIDPPDPELLLEYGKALFAADKTSLARNAFLAVVSRVQKGPGAGEAYTDLGLIAQRTGDREAATAYFRQAESAAPGAAATREVADLLFAGGAFDDARAQYLQLAQRATGDSDRQYFDGQAILCRLRGSRPGEADRDIATFNARYPADREDAGRFALERALVQFRAGEYAKTLALLRRVVDDFGGTRIGPAARYWMAKSLDATGKADEAKELLGEILDDNPTDPVIPRVQFALGTIAFNAEQWPEAVRRFRVIVEDPNADTSLLPAAMNNLIETYEITTAYDGALALARRYLELFPNADDVLDKRIKIGILYTKLGYFDQAILQLQSLLDEAPGDLEGELRYYIGEANYNKGDFQQAILEFLKVPYLVTRKGKIDWTANSLYMAGQSYERMSRFDQALTMYQQIVDRPGIDESFRAAARKEIDRVRIVLNKGSH